MKLIGLHSQKVYFIGRNKTDCLRYLNEKFPFKFKDNSHNLDGHSHTLKLMPEPMKVYK